jgi:hypothetical protein
MRKKDCARWWKNASRTGRIAEGAWKNGRLIDTPLGAPYTEFTICRLEKWGSAVKIGRGPATVIGNSAVSQATLLSRIGCLSFAREDPSGNGPEISRGFFVVRALAQPSSGEIRATISVYCRAGCMPASFHAFVFMCGEASRAGNYSIPHAPARHTRSCGRSWP